MFNLFLIEFYYIIKYINFWWNSIYLISLLNLLICSKFNDRVLPSRVHPLAVDNCSPVAQLHASCQPTDCEPSEKAASSGKSIEA